MKLIFKTKVGTTQPSPREQARRNFSLQPGSAASIGPKGSAPIRAMRESSSAFALILSVVVLATCVIAGAADDPYNPVSKTKETITRSPDGGIINVVRVTETTVTHKETITETLVPGAGQLKTSQRQTVTVDTRGNKITTVETLQGKPARLKVSSVTTEIKGANGSGVITVQSIGSDGNLTVTKRTVIARSANGKLVTTEETRGPDGEMTITKQIIAD